MRNNGVVQRKLALLATQTTNLRRHLEGIDRKVFVDDWALRSMAERALQVAAEIVIDIAERLIATQGAGPVATATDAIRRLAELGMIKSAAPYLDIVRFRNLIVHEYEQIDADVLFTLATEHLEDFGAFRAEIDALEE
jgi:uncharacterized protein YutE (UPF0331/DUF86 family)